MHPTGHSVSCCPPALRGGYGNSLEKCLATAVLTSVGTQAYTLYRYCLTWWENTYHTVLSNAQYFLNISNSVFCVSADTFCSSLVGPRPCTAQLLPATLWRPARYTRLHPGPCQGTPSHGLPLAWRNPISTATGNVLPSVPSSSPSPWCSCWPTLLVSSPFYIPIHP